MYPALKKRKRTESPLHSGGQSQRCKARSCYNGPVQKRCCLLEAAAIKGEKFMDKYVCTLCGYEYDPALGDPDNGIAPGTPFEDLPEDWTCPLCGAAKSDFEKVE